MIGFHFADGFMDFDAWSLDGYGTPVYASQEKKNGKNPAKRMYSPSKKNKRRGPRKTAPGSLPYHHMQGPGF